MNIFLRNAFLLCTTKLGNNLTKNIPNVINPHFSISQLHPKIVSFYFSQQQVKLNFTLLG